MFPDSMASTTYSSADQFADILTKGLSILLFRRHYSNLMLGSSKPAIEGECQDIKGLLLPHVKRIENKMVRRLLILLDN
jgi:hypothetical protein